MLPTSGVGSRVWLGWVLLSSVGDQSWPSRLGRPHEPDPNPQSWYPRSMTESNGRYLESRSDSEDEGWIPAERSLAHSHGLCLPSLGAGTRMSVSRLSLVVHLGGRGVARSNLAGARDLPNESQLVALGATGQETDLYCPMTGVDRHSRRSGGHMAEPNL